MAFTVEVRAHCSKFPTNATAFNSLWRIFVHYSEKVKRRRFWKSKIPKTKNIQRHKQNVGMWVSRLQSCKFCFILSWGGICILLLLQKNNYNHLSQKYENQTITKPNAAFKSNRFLMTTKCAGNLKHNTDVMLLTVKHKNRNHVRLSLRRFEFISHMGP